MNPIEDRGYLNRRGGVADQDAKSVALQVTRFQLVRVPRHAQDADAVAIELGNGRFARPGDGNPLASHRPAVLQSRGADVAVRNVQSAGHLSDEILGPKVGLLDP